MITHLEDARVHCVVLKVRAVPSPHAALRQSEKVLRFSCLRRGIRSLRTQQRACAGSLASSFPDPKVVLTRGSILGTSSNVPPMSSGRAHSARIRLCQARRPAVLLRKEVIQPHLPVRLPCYDLVLITDPTFDGSLHKGWATGFRCYRLS